MQSCTCPAHSPRIHYRIPSAMAEDVTHSPVHAVPLRIAMADHARAVDAQGAPGPGRPLRGLLLAALHDGSGEHRRRQRGFQRGLQWHPRGPQVDDVGLTYVIRFLKGWSPGVHAFRGDKLPILRDGADTFPWERQGADLKPDSPRNHVLTLLQYASQNKILGRLNRAKPDSMEAILNEFLRSQKIDDLLLSETKITSHR